jgi:hypothetical protein
LWVPELLCGFEQTPFLSAQFTEPAHILEVHMVKVYDQGSARAEMVLDAFKARRLIL